jgi:hypothetical protein
MNRQQAQEMARSLECDTVREALEKIRAAWKTCDAVCGVRPSGWREVYTEAITDLCGCALGLREHIEPEPEQSAGSMTYEQAVAHATSLFGFEHRNPARKFREIAAALEVGPDRDPSAAFEQFEEDVEAEKKGK